MGLCLVYNQIKKGGNPSFKILKKEPYMLLKNLVTISGDHCQPTTGHPNGDRVVFSRLPCEPCLP